MTKRSTPDLMPLSYENPTPKQYRALLANEMLEAISLCGRRFFRNGMTVSYFALDGRGRIWYVDKWTQRPIYTHRSDWGRKFSEGGTLQSLCKALRDFIRTGVPISRHHFGPWAAWVCGSDLWGYGEDMEKVRTAARTLGIVQMSEEELKAAERRETPTETKEVEDALGSA